MRSRTERIAAIKSALAEAIASGGHRPGTRFLSNRKVAEKFGINYRTAHRLMQELEQEGLLIRRRGSGSYSPGTTPERVRLVFHPLAQRVNNARNHAFEALQNELARRQIDFHVTFWNNWKRGKPEEYYVFYGELYERLSSLSGVRQALYLNVNCSPVPRDLIPRLDNVAIDIPKAGELAATYLRRRLPADSSVILLSASAESMTSQLLFEALRKKFPRASRCILTSRPPEKYGFGEDVVDVLRQGYEGILCGNTKILSELIGASSARGIPLPRMVTCDRYRFSEQTGLPAVMLPYREVIPPAIEIISRRMSGDTSPPVDLLLSPHLALNR